MSIVDLVFDGSLDETAVLTVTDVFAGPAIMAVPSLDAEGATKIKVPDEPANMGVLTKRPQDVFSDAPVVMAVPTLASEFASRPVDHLGRRH